MDKVVKLLAYISDKDLFSEFYRKKLARRLLNDFSASDELERSILSRLKQQCGAQFTSKVSVRPNSSLLGRTQASAPCSHFNVWQILTWKRQRDETERRLSNQNFAPVYGIASVYGFKRARTQCFTVNTLPYL